MKSNQIVIKPWGREYLCYRNEEVAIWVLEIKNGFATSLHCHPRKNTALIVLQGDVELSFIRDISPHRLFGLDKINIFRGRFHRTRAVSEGVVLLEVETPEDKRDIVRMEDDYGRENVPIENPTMPLDKNCLQIVDDNQIKKFAGCALSIFKPEPVQITQLDPSKNHHIFVTLNGGLERGLLPAGDAIDGRILSRFTQQFKPIYGTSFLHIWKI